MRHVMVTIPDEYYGNLVDFLKPIPESAIDNSEEEYNLKIQAMVLDRVKNAKPEDYVDARESVQRLKVKYGFHN